MKLPVVVLRHLCLVTLLLAGLGATSSVSAAPAEVLSITGNRNVADFREAKKLLKKIFVGHEETLYCGCRYYGKELNLNSCGIAADGTPPRLARLEWEHMVPAAKFGEAIAAWQTGDVICEGASGRRRHGRKCAEKASPLFRQMEGDLYNLWPESGQINGDRSNKPPVETVVSTKSYGSCETVIGRREFAPRPAVRGTVARAYLYMNWAYQVSLSEEQARMFARWNQEHPPTPWECERAARIKAAQGNPNPFVERGCAPSS